MAEAQKPAAAPKTSQSVAIDRILPLGESITSEQGFRTDNAALSRYSNIRLWAEGAFGKTFLAENENGRTVLIKKLVFGNGDHSPAEKLEAIDNFRKEARILRNLDHENIPKYIDSFATEEGGKLNFCLVQEFAGKSLAQHLEERNFTEQEAITIGKQILSALVYLQSTSPPRLHRDISPENITIDENGKAYLVDFGAAVLKTRGTVTGTIIGKHGYAPPEQLMLGKAIPASDVYGLGATIIALVTGKQPAELMEQKGGNYKIAFMSHATISAKFADVLEKMTEHGLDKRFGNAKEALNAFESLGNTELVLSRDIIRDALIKAGYGLEVADRTLREQFGKASGTTEVEVVSQDMAEFKSGFKTKVREVEKALKDLHKKIRKMYGKVKGNYELEKVFGDVTIENRFAADLKFEGELKLGDVRLYVKTTPNVSLKYYSHLNEIEIRFWIDRHVSIFEHGGWIPLKVLKVNEQAPPGRVGVVGVSAHCLKIDIVERVAHSLKIDIDGVSPKDNELSKVKKYLSSLDWSCSDSRQETTIEVKNQEWYARVPFTNPLGVSIHDQGEYEISIAKYLKHTYVFTNNPSLSEVSEARIATIMNLPKIAEELLEIITQRLQERIEARKRILTAG